MTHAIFTLRSSEATRKHFPYEFEFQVSYELEGPRLTVTYRLVNLDEQNDLFLGRGPSCLCRTL